jgi:hypothetical protein
MQIDNSKVKIKMNPAQHINQTSGKVEYYTPPEIIEPVRKTMGAIDLDPASSDKANKIVGASHIYRQPSYTTFHSEQYSHPIRLYESRGGLDFPWHGRIWLNAPFTTGEKGCETGCKKKTCIKRGWHSATPLPSTGDWIEKLVHEYKKGNITTACTITFASTSESWFKPLKPYAMCLIDGRTHYLDSETLKPIKGATKGSIVTYLGPDVAAFARAFAELGEVKVSYQA